MKWEEYKVTEMMKISKTLDYSNLFDGFSRLQLKTLYAVIEDFKLINCFLDAAMIISGIRIDFIEVHLTIKFTSGEESGFRIIF